MLYEKIEKTLAQVQSNFMELASKRESLLKLRTRAQQCEVRLNYIETKLSPELQKSESVKAEVQELLSEQNAIEEAFNELGYGTVATKQPIKPASKAKKGIYLETDVAESKE